MPLRSCTDPDLPAERLRGRGDDRADGIECVAEQLATSDNYRADTERYVRDRASGVDVVEAVNRWVDGSLTPTAHSPRHIASPCAAS